MPNTQGVESTLMEREKVSPETKSSSKTEIEKVKAGQKAIIGFSINPARQFLIDQREKLQEDLSSLLSSLTYHPQHIDKVTLDLRYIVEQDNSLARKHLNIILLVCIHFDPRNPPRDADEVLQKYEEDLYNLLSLHINTYEIRIEVLSEKKVSRFLKPFKVTKDVVEITRRVIRNTPFEVSTFVGSSSMTKIIDMMLLEKGQCCYSVLLQPYQLSKEELEAMEAFGYSGKMLPPKIDKEIALAFSEAMPFELGTMSQPMFASFRMKVRLFSDSEISQYLVNLVGSEVSGQGDFMPLRGLNSIDFNEEVEGFTTLDFYPLFQKVVPLNVPPLLLVSRKFSQGKDIAKH